MKNIIISIVFLLSFVVSFLSVNTVTFAAVDFSDIENSYAKNAINELVEKGIINGYPDGEFRPTSAIKRQDFAIILAKALNLNLTNSPSTPTFTDIPTTHYAYPAIEAAVKAGLVNGIGDEKFGVGSGLTRQEMATLFARAIGGETNGLGEQLTFADQHKISAWARDAVGFAVASNLMTGDTLNRFNPQGNAERQQVALVASRFLKQIDKVTPEPEPKPEPKPESKPEPKPEPNSDSDSDPDPSPSPSPSVIPVVGITLNEGIENLQIGETKTLTVTVIPANATNKLVRWTSSDLNVATVNGQGKVIATGIGTVTITATTVDGLKTASVTFTVTHSNGAAITGVGTSSSVLQLGETTSRTAETTESGTITWSSSNTGVATVHSSTGEITAHTPGITTISYTSSNGKMNSVSLTVYDEATAKSPTYSQVLQMDEVITASIGAGLSATATSKSFVAEPTSVATVNATTGQVTAISAGSSVITYVGMDANGIVIEKGTTTVTVHPQAAVAAIPMVPAPYSVIGWGSAATNFTPPGVGQSIIWTVTNGTGAATIQQSTGAIRGVTAGDVTVNYKIVDNNTRVVAYKSAPVTVTIPDTPRVNISPPYVDGGTFGGPYSMSTNVNLTVAITGENNSTVIFSNPRSNDDNIATATITGPNPSGHVFLNVQKIGTGEAQITFDYTDINNNTGSMTWIFNFQ
ncbi:S-layer homology domain-containing protein [Lysinibacillus capsici]|uniref:S-layer homology domain-containing protein n=1 Tax=Lysinibacillus capsici TaxID=2115968 RepID=UPI0034E4AF56